eukprot:scaffold3156_cov105-Isochrysis_galbana.AAC.2
MWDGAKGVGSVAEPRHEDGATVRDKRGHSSTFRGALEFCRPRRCSLKRRGWTYLIVVGCLRDGCLAGPGIEPPSAAVRVGERCHPLVGTRHVRKPHRDKNPSAKHQGAPFFHKPPSPFSPSPLLIAEG